MLDRDISALAEELFNKPVSFLLGTFREVDLRDTFLNNLKEQGYDAITFKEGPIRFTTTFQNRANIYIPLDTNKIEIKRIYEGRLTPEKWTRSSGEIVTIRNVEDFNKTFFASYQTNIASS